MEPVLRSIYSNVYKMTYYGYNNYTDLREAKNKVAIGRQREKRGILVLGVCVLFCNNKSPHTRPLRAAQSLSHSLLQCVRKIRYCNALEKAEDHTSVSSFHHKTSAAIIRRRFLFCVAPNPLRQAPVWLRSDFSAFAHAKISQSPPPYYSGT
ncbi:hypothetical protein ACQKLN_29530 [Paenibacillus glucanolyticus]|uniref:hypothetical protein n=1 Tax=Paenibacillus glucanolyticus TaxID=59843 RepID=UPI003D0681E1